MKFYCKKFTLAAVIAIGVLMVHTPFLSAAERMEIMPEQDVELSTLVQFALEYNPEIRAAKAKWEAMKKRQIQAWSLEDPMFGVDVMGEMEESRVGPEENRLMVSQEIPFPLKLWKRRQIAKENAKAAFEEYAATSRDVVNRITQTFYELYWADASVGVIQEIHALLKKLEGVAESRYASGSVAQRDVAKAQAEVSLTLEQLFMLEQKRESLAGMMNALLDRSPLLGFGKIVKPAQPKLEKSLAELLTLASKDRQELKGQQAMVKGAEHEKSLAWMQNIPDLQMGFSYTWVGGGMTTDAEDGKDSWMFPLAINVPLWQNKNIPAIQEAEKEIEAAQAKLSAIKNETFYEVKDAHVRFETASKVLTLYETAVIPQAELALKSDQAGYEAGRVDFLNLLDSERVYLNAGLSYIEFYAEALKSFADLERAVGSKLTA